MYKKSDFSNLNEETEIETPKEKNKLFKSLRRIGNFSNIKPYHKFDKNSFNKEQLLNDIIHASPKISQMMTNINILDENDKKKYGKSV